MRLLPLLLFLLTACNSPELTIYVSPVGNDKYEGTKEKPVATLERAKQIIKKLRQQHVEKDTITVFLREGVYRVKRGITFDADDAGSEKSPVIYRSYKGENVIISGAIPIEKYESLSHNNPLFKKDPAKAREIIEIDLHLAGLSKFYPIRLSGFSGENKPLPYTLQELYFNGEAMPLSRWPNNGYSEFTDVVSDKTLNSGIVYKDKHISTWKNEPNIVLHGYWKYLWADAYEHVSKIDTIRNQIWLMPPYNHYNFVKNHPFAAYNVISEIDKPGEWAYDYKKGKIYFYPPKEITNSSLELSVCKDPLLVLNNTQWITFKNITFEMGAAEGIRISESKHITLNNCKIHGCARDGIVINGGKSNTVASCSIYDMGRGAIKVAGGDRETLEKSDFHIDNCHIHNLSRIDRTYTPGIWVDGVGTTITHCKIHDIASSAMRINGNDHTIEYNEMYRAVTESDDQGAVDMWGDPTYRGNVFRYNYIHDIGPLDDDEIKAHCGRAGMRFDDAISGTLVYGNIFKNCSGGNFGAIQIHGGKENLIQNNLFYDCSAGISFTSWGEKFWMNYTKRSLGVFQRNRELYTEHYPSLNRLNDDLNENTAIQNVFLKCDRTTLRMPKVNTFQDNIENKEYSGSVNPAKDNYSMSDISEILKRIKFETIPFEKIGLKK